MWCISFTFYLEDRETKTQMSPPIYWLTLKLGACVNGQDPHHLSHQHCLPGSTWTGSPSQAGTWTQELRYVMWASQASPSHFTSHGTPANNGTAKSVPRNWGTLGNIPPLQYLLLSFSEVSKWEWHPLWLWASAPRTYGTHHNPMYCWWTDARENKWIASWQ